MIEFLIWQGHDGEHLMQRATGRQINLWAELAQRRMKNIYGGENEGRGRSR